MKIEYLPPQQAKAEDLPAISTLLGSVYKQSRAWLEDITWHYLENPSGPAWYVNARADDDGSLVGHYAVIPAPPLRDSSFAQHRVFISLNTAVHPRAQGKGVFKRSALSLFEQLGKLNPSVVLGAANASSIPGFTGALGFHNLGRLELHAYPPGTWPKPLPERALEVDDPFLSWRSRRPHARMAMVPGRNALLRRTHFRGLPVDAILSIDLPSNAVAPLTVPRRPPLPWPMTPRIYATFGAASKSLLRVPDRLRPSPMYYICRQLPGSNTAPLINFLMERRFEFIDFDVV